MQNEFGPLFAGRQDRERARPREHAHRRAAAGSAAGLSSESPQNLHCLKKVPPFFHCKMQIRHFKEYLVPKIGVDTANRSLSSRRFAFKPTLPNLHRRASSRRGSLSTGEKKASPRRTARPTRSPRRRLRRRTSSVRPMAYFSMASCFEFLSRLLVTVDPSSQSLFDHFSHLPSLLSSTSQTRSPRRCVACVPAGSLSNLGDPIVYSSR